MTTLDLYYDGEVSALENLNDLGMLARYNYLGEAALTGWLVNGQYYIPFNDFMRGLDILYNSPKELKLDRANFRRLVSILDHSPLTDDEVVNVLEKWKPRIDREEPRLPSIFWIRSSTKAWLSHTLGESVEFSQWRSTFGYNPQMINRRLREFRPMYVVDLENPDGPMPSHIDTEMLRDDEGKFISIAGMHMTTPERLARYNFLKLVKNGNWNIIRKYAFFTNSFHVVMNYFLEGIISEWSMVQFFWNFSRSFVATADNVVGISYLPYHIRYWIMSAMDGNYRGTNVRSSREYEWNYSEELTKLIGVPTLEPDDTEAKIEQQLLRNPSLLTPRTIQEVGRWSIVMLLRRIVGPRLPFDNFWRQVHVLHDNEPLLRFMHRTAGEPAISPEDYHHVLRHYCDSPRCLKWLLDSGLLVIDQHTDQTTLSLLQKSLLPPRVGTTGRVIDIFDLYPLACSMIKTIDLEVRQQIVYGVNPREMTPLIYKWLTRVRRR